MQRRRFRSCRTNWPAVGEQLESSDLVAAEPQRKAMKGRREALAAQIEDAKENQHVERD